MPQLVRRLLALALLPWTGEAAEGLPRVDGSEPTSVAAPPEGASLSERASSSEAPIAASGRTELGVLGVTMPKAVSTPAPYPAGASSSASVLLELTIDVEGQVAQSKILVGPEPFASAALAASRQWKFAPALRNAQAIPARIRFVVRFSPPETQRARERPPSGDKPTPASSTSSKASSPPISATTSKAQPQVLEVTIQGEKPEAAVVSMGRSDVEQLPGAFGDPFRAIEVLPGITPIVSGLPFFFIRGAPPGNQGYFLDGIRVPLLYHMAAGPGVIHPALVDRVDLYPGGYPARHGRFAGAVIAAESKDPPAEYHAHGTVRLVDSGAYVTAPLGRGAVAFGGRYSYTGAVVSLIAPQIKIEYWDYQAKAVQYLSDRDTLGVFAFGALDLVHDKSTQSAEGLVGTEFHRVDLRYQRRIDDRTRLRTAVTVGFDKTLAGGAMTLRDRMVAARSDWEQHFGADTVLRAGVDIMMDIYDVKLPIPDGANIQLRAALPERTDVVAGAWVDISLRPSRSITLVPGLRFDNYWSGNAMATAIEPRVSAIYELRRNTRLVHAFGIAHQPPSFIVPLPGAQVSGLREGLQRGVQSSAGVELDLPKDITASATLFQNASFNLTDQLSAINRPTGDSDQIEFGRRSRGRTFGAELLVRRSFSQRIGGLLAYTISKSWRTIDGIRIPAAFDRRHVLQAALAFNLGRNWRSSVRGVYYSGLPSYADGGVIVPGSPTVQRTNPEYLPRAPAYWRLDLRLQKRWLVGERGAYWAVTFEVLNATLNKEAISQSCSATSCKIERLGPITIPSIGVEAAY